MQPAGATDTTSLTADDLVTVLDALGDLGIDPDTQPPYAVDDDVSFLKNHTWLVGQVAAIEPAEGPAGQWVVTVRLPQGSVVRTVDGRGVGGGVAPLRDH